MGELFQGDLDLGRLAVERLAGGLGPGVVVEDLHYGAVAVVQLLEDLRPATLVLVGAAARGRPAGTVERRRLGADHLSPEQVQQAVSEAVTGYVDIDLVVAVAAGLGALPARTISIEVEPAATAPSEQLSPEGEAALEEALELVRTEVRRAPVLELAGSLRALLGGNRLEPTPAVRALEVLLGQLELLDREGHWGRAFAERDRLRLRIAEGGTGEGMDHLDWGLWWALIEELDRLEAVEVGPEAR